MRLISEIMDSDFFGGDPEVMEYVSRHASRGVLINNELQVAMMEMTMLKLYKLPGGGVEEGEDNEGAFLREIREETGFDAIIIRELGYIDEHKNRNDFMQRSFCYIAKAVDLPGDVSLTESEIHLGMQVKWMQIKDAINHMINLVNNCEDYSANFMLKRDLIILDEADKWLAE